jgi:hypothetical protein
MGKLSPCEDGGSSLKWVGGNMGKGSGKRVRDEGRRADDEAEAVGLPCRWAGEMVVLCEYIKDGEAGTAGASEPCREQFVLHAGGGEHGIGIWCEVRHGRVKTKG